MINKQMAPPCRFRAALLAPLAMALVLPGLAQAQAAPLPMSEVIAGLEGQGYRILEAEAKGRWIEVEVLASDGRRKELILDPVTAAVLHEDFED